MLGMATYYERERILLDEASRDYLTGLLNLRGFYAEIDAFRQTDLPLAIYLFDLDNLKKVNDQYGHEAGDEMLKYFAKFSKITHEKEIFYVGTAAMNSWLSSEESVTRKLL